MLIAGLVILIWVALVMRYPSRALLVSAVGLCSLLSTGGITLLLEQREARLLEQVSIRLRLAADCPAALPLLVEVHNPHPAAVRELRWQLSAHQPAGYDELLASPQAAQQAAPSPLPGGAHWQQCVAVPAMRPGYPLNDILFEAVRRRGSFD